MRFTLVLESEMSPVSFFINLNQSFDWRRQLEDAEISINVDQALTDINSFDPDVLFVGHMRTSFGEFPFDVHHNPGTNSICIQVYFRDERERLMSLFDRIFPEEFEPSDNHSTQD